MFYAEARETDMILQKTESEMSVARPGFNGQTEEFFVVHAEGSTVILNAYSDMIPLVRLQ